MRTPVATRLLIWPLGWNCESLPTKNWDSFRWGPASSSIQSKLRSVGSICMSRKNLRWTYSTEVVGTRFPTATGVKFAVSLWLFLHTGNLCLTFSLFTYFGQGDSILIAADSP
jgi:hypothetical protein